MVPKKERLSRKEFTTLGEEKGLYSVYNPLGTLKFSPKGRRISVVISARSEPKAVRRNFLRRKLYTLFNLSKEASLSGILYLSKQAPRFEVKEIEQLFHDLLSKAQKTSQ